MRSRSKPGDWIIGLAAKNIRSELGHPDIWRLVYAMHIEERLDLHSYYMDARYRAKRPQRSGSAIERCGDNFYRRGADGRLVHTRETDEHEGEAIEKQDIDGNRVFVGSKFWYFGRNARALPVGEQWADRLIAKFATTAVGLRNVYERGAVQEDRWTSADLANLAAWLPAEHGLLGMPTHWPAESDPPSRSFGCASRCAPQERAPNERHSAVQLNVSRCGT
jgi:hypothetical protein